MSDVSSPPEISPASNGTQAPAAISSIAATQSLSQGFSSPATPRLTAHTSEQRGEGCGGATSRGPHNCTTDISHAEGSQQPAVEPCPPMPPSTSLDQPSKVVANEATHLVAAPLPLSMQPCYGRANSTALEDAAASESVPASASALVSQEEGDGELSDNPDDARGAEGSRHVESVQNSEDSEAHRRHSFPRTSSHLVVPAAALTEAVIAASALHTGDHVGIPRPLGPIGAAMPPDERVPQQGGDGVPPPAEARNRLQSCLGRLWRLVAFPPRYWLVALPAMLGNGLLYSYLAFFTDLVTEKFGR